jgi:hypothetical protein
MLAGTAALEYWYETGKSFEQLPWIKWPLILLNLGREQTLGSWWTAVLLATAGALLLLISGIRTSGAAPARQVLLPLLGGLVLLGFSLDEEAAFHERVFAANPDDAASAFGSPAPWLLPAIPLAALLLLAWRRLRGRAASWTAVTTWSGIAALCVVPLLKEIETSQYAPGQRPPPLLLLEEGTELLGAWLLLAAGLLLLSTVTGEHQRVLVSFREQLRRRWWLILNVAGIVSVLGTQASLSRYGDYAGDPQSGLAQWWFGSLAAAALAAVAFLARGAAPRTVAHPATALTVIGWSAVVLCVAFGIDGFTWLTVADASLDRVARIVLAVVMGVAGLWLVLTWRLAGLAVAAVSVIVALGHAAASAWEVGALWAATALVHEATLLRGRTRSSMTGAVYPPSVRPPARPAVSSSSVSSAPTPRTGPPVKVKKNTKRPKPKRRR